MGRSGVYMKIIAHMAMLMLPTISLIPLWKPEEQEGMGTGVQRHTR